jgi:competence protein ComEA
VLGVLVLLVAVGLILGVRVVWARSSAKPEAVASAAHGSSGAPVTRTVPAAFAPTAGTPTTASVLQVHVVGQVRKPGVVHLPAGSRVLEAVTAAGGAGSSADLNHLNLARLVIDGEQIVVPKPGEIMGAASGSQGTGPGAASQGSTGGGPPSGLVDLNSADATALDSLPGVGPVLSQRILDWRKTHGRFSSVDELGEVSGIGDKLLAQIGPKVKV